MRERICLRTCAIAFLAVALSTACLPGALALAREDVGQGAGAASATASSEASAGSASVSADASASSAPASADASSVATYKKSEAVYAKLSASGSAEAVYVVNRFDVERAGLVVDHGDYSSVQNLTNEIELTRKGDATSFEAGEGALYYQGDAVSTALPWDVSLAYELNGKKIAPDELAGASGDLAIHVATVQNKAVDAAFYDSFMMQITFTLPGDAATEVAAEGATVASAGEDATVAFTVLPGHDGDFTLTAKVQDFEMPGVQFAALPYSSVVEMPDTDEMVGGMASLSDAVSALAEGTASLASGVDELTSGAQSLSSGSASFGQGLDQLDASSGMLTGASADIREALAAIAVGLQGADLSQLDQLKQLPGGLTALAGGLRDLRSGMAKAQQGYASALPALETAIDAIPVGSLTKEQIGSLIALAQASGSQGDLATANELAATYQAAQVVKGAYAQIKPAFDGANDVLAACAADGGALSQQEAALRALASSLESSVGDGKLDQLSQLASGIAELSGQYGRFHDGLVQYASGLSALAQNYAQLESGASQLASGTGQLAGGAGELSSGMGQLNASTVTLPETMKEQIAQMTEEFDFPEFAPVSFASPQNANVEAVQFVMTTAAIEQPEAPQAEEPEQEQTIWDRFLALFQG